MELSAPMAGKTLLVAVLVVVGIWWALALSSLGAILVLAIVLAAVGWVLWMLGKAVNRRFLRRMGGGS